MIDDLLTDFQMDDIGDCDADEQHVLRSLFALHSDHGPGHAIIPPLYLSKSRRQGAVVHTGVRRALARQPW